jgi:hypothetical protein
VCVCVVCVKAAIRLVRGGCGCKDAASLPALLKSAASSHHTHQPRLVYHHSPHPTHCCRAHQALVLLKKEVELCRLQVSAGAAHWLLTGRKCCSCLVPLRLLLDASCLPSSAISRLDIDLHY